MTELKQAVEKKQPGNSQSRNQRQAAGSSSNKKPAAKETQPKSTAAKSHAKASTVTPTRSRSAVSSSSRPKNQPTGTETDENSNRSLLEETSFSHFSTNSFDEPEVEVFADREQQKEPQTNRTKEPVEEENLAQLKHVDQHKSKDKAKPLAHSSVVDHPGEASMVTDPTKELRTLQKKVRKSEKKVNKLKKKVYKAEKKVVKKSKLKSLKDKLTKALAKWQRRKKRLEAE